MSTLATIRGVSAPDSEFTRKATSLAARIHDKSTLNHVHRTWWFADFLGQKRGMKYDREVLYLSTILHDLGLTEDFAADGRFEVDGADAARRTLRESGYSDQKAQLVWESIALHSSLGIADHLGPEVCLCCLGAHADVFGMNLEEITPSIVDDTLALYPRVGFKRAFQQALAEVARKKPHLAAGTGLADIGKRHIHGFSCPNVCDMIDGSPFES